MTTAARAVRLAELLAPLGLRDFVTEYVGKQPLLLRGRPDNGRRLISLDRIVEAVACPDGETGRLLVSDANLSEAEDVWAYVESGQPIVWNGVRGATDALDALTLEVARAFGASVWANVYSTGTAAKPFDVHFDCHDVLAVQCEGAKQWFVSEVRVNCPLDVPALAPTIRRALEERREEALRESLMTVVTEPGDVLYIPRGQFHDARTPSGRSLHVTFAIAPPTGIDAIEALARLALGEALFRQYLPHELANGPCSTEAHMERLADRLGELTRGPELRAELDLRRDERNERRAP
jgi:lysine-specific demethylase/histidyl-hydroxylase NO66